MAPLTSPVTTVLAATDRSLSGDAAARWAADLASSYQSKLQVLVPNPDGGDAIDQESVNRASQTLTGFADELAGQRGRGLVVVDSDPAKGILDAIDSQHVDVVVLGNAGMSGRKQFLLGNVPNRVSHKARCTVIIVNTTSEADGMPPRVTIESSAPPSRRMLRRAWRIGRVLVKAGLNELRERRPPASEDTARLQAQRLRVALDELGPTFAKLGQVLSTRPDLLPQSFLDELAVLQERVTPLTEAEVVQAMEKELQVPWEDVFESIDPKPLAAGTIAQVHRATLESGDRVVVKVQRPNAEELILDDLSLLELFGRKAARRPAFQSTIDLPAIIEQLSSSLRRELDFRLEAQNLKRMKEQLTSYSRLDVPKVYEAYSTAKLLVMEEIQGVAVREAPEGEARRDAARQLLESYYCQVLEQGFFHADPHPGNMKWWNDQIYLLDLGMVGEVDEQVRSLILMLLLAFTQEDAAFLSEVVLMLAGENAQPADEAAFRGDLQRFIDKYRNLSLREIQLGPMLQEITETAVRHGIQVPSSLALVGKAFAQMQLAAAALDPELDPFSVAEAFVVKKTLRQVTQGLKPKALFYEAQKAQLRFTRIIEAVESLVGARPGAKLQVQFQGMERLEQTIAQAGRRLAFAFGLGGAFIGLAMTFNSNRAPRWLPPLMGSVASVLSTGLVVDAVRSVRQPESRESAAPPDGS